MPKKKSQQIARVNYDEIDTIVGPDITIIGDIVSGGSARYEGNLKGNISISGNLIIGRNALVSGNVNASNIHIIGTVEGNVACEHLKILSTGKLTGDAYVENIMIDEGAVFIGSCKTIDEDSDKDINQLISSVED